MARRRLRTRVFEHAARPRTRGAGVDVWAVEDRRAQLVWTDLPPGAVRIDVGHRRLQLDHAGGPGAVELADMAPATRTTVVVRGADGTTARRRVATLPTPPGEELFRFATINDLHLGRGEQGLRGHLPHGNHESASHPLATARDAVAEALDWGAAMLVVKGDICDESHTWTWEQAAKLLADVPVPVHLVPGNHDTGRLRSLEPEQGAARHGLALTRGVDHVDVPGLRVVLVDSADPGNGWGRVARHAERVADLARDAHGGVFVAAHHQPQRFRVPLYWPHGIPAPDAHRFAEAVVAANPHALASSGHTHRCRIRSVRGLPWSEVAATNHFPGVWAGYRVFEGGIMQVVRRTADPGTLAWTEHARDALGGVWALWATGTRSDRCFTLDWT